MGAIVTPPPCWLPSPWEQLHFATTTNTGSAAAADQGEEQGGLRRLIARLASISVNGAGNTINIIFNQSGASSSPPAPTEEEEEEAFYDPPPEGPEVSPEPSSSPSCAFIPQRRGTTGFPPSVKFEAGSQWWVVWHIPGNSEALQGVHGGPHVAPALHERCPGGRYTPGTGTHLRHCTSLEQAVDLYRRERARHENCTWPCPVFWWP